MNRILLLLNFGSVLYAQTITSIEPTSKEIVVRYTAPDATTACTPDANYTSNFADATNRLIDVDPSHFANSNSDISRNPKLTGTRYRTVVIGQQAPFWKTRDASAVTGYRSSRAIKAFSSVWVKMTCNGVSDTKIAHTKTVPFMSFAEATPADPSAPGFTNYPQINWTATETIIDDEYGTQLTRPQLAGSQAPVVLPASGFLSFQEAIGSGWTNQLNALADDSSSATISASQNVLFFPWPYGAQALGTPYLSLLDGTAYDWFQLQFKGTNTAATAADGSVQVALYIDGGVTPYSPWHDVDLRSCSSGCTYPSSQPTGFNHWLNAGDRPIPAQWMTKRSGTLKYVASTSTVTLTHPLDAFNNPTGDHVQENWKVGSKIRVLASAIHVAAITSGTPITVEFIENHGLTTGQSITISGLDVWSPYTDPGMGSCAPIVNGTWFVTVDSVDPKKLTLNNSSGTCTFGRTYTVLSATDGSPPMVVDGSVDLTNVKTYYVKFSGFVDSGWTTLNTGYFQIADAGYTFLKPGGATTTGAYTSGATMTVLVGAAQPFTDWTITGIVDADTITVSGGPGSDITVDTPWTFSPIVFGVRKKTTSADTINLQYVGAKIGTSAGTAWGAAGSSPCYPYSATRPTDGMKGLLCLMGDVLNFLPADGSAPQPTGSVPMPAAADGGNLGGQCILGPGSNGQRYGQIGVNPNDPARLYCSYRVLDMTGPGAPGYDQKLFIGQYEGDFAPRSSSETPDAFAATYPTYGSYLGSPWLPNCYGNGKWNDGINPRVVETHCMSYKLIIDSVKSLIQTNDTTVWPKIESDIRDLYLWRTQWTWQTATQSVWMSIETFRAQDLGGIMYFLDLGNEKPISDPTSTIAYKGLVTSWGETEPSGYGRIHGGVGLHDGYAEEAVQIMLWEVGAGVTGQTLCQACGPYLTNYTSVDGVSNAPLTHSLQSCAPWAPSPYLPTPTPDGTGDKGCNQIVVSGEPCDASMSTTEARIVSLNTSFYTTKCGAPSMIWLRDAKPGDMFWIDKDSDRYHRDMEPAVLIARTGNTWVLGRGWLHYVCNGCGITGTGTLDHTGDTHDLMATFNWDTTTGFYPAYIKSLQPIGTVQYPHISVGHGAEGSHFAAGSTGSSTYGVQIGTVQERFAQTAFNYEVPARGDGGLQFEGKFANNNTTVDSHLNFSEKAAALNNQVWMIDGGPWNGYSSPGDLVPTVVGTANHLHVYKWTGAELNTYTFTNQFIKFLPLEIRVGYWVLRNISGPGSDINDSKPYTVCIAYKPNDCVSGSAAGDVYFSVPLIDTLSGVYQCCGNDFSKTRDVSITAKTVGTSQYFQILMINDKTSNTHRGLTGIHVPHAEDSFKNWAVTDDGNIGMFRERGLDFYRSEFFTMKMPPIITDGIDRSHFWHQILPIHAYAGADNVLVRFGYAHYGDVTNGQYYCTSNYKDNCVMGAGTTASNPYYFETGDTGYSGISCATGCSVNLPLIPNRVAYEEVVYRSGTTVLYTTPQQVVVSP